MVNGGVFFRLSLWALLILLTHGYPTKGLNSHQEASSDSDQSAHHHGGAGGYAPMAHTKSRHVSRPMQGFSPSQYVYRNPASGSMSYISGAEYPSGFVPVGYPSSSQTEAAQSNPPEIKWSVDPKIFSEEGLANSEAVSSSNFVPAPPGPVLQSGETSNVVKEAELGNYQQETEEIGYPTQSMGPGYGSYPHISPFLPIGGWGGYPGLFPYPYSYPAFDFRLLYGLYPPGTYTTFSKSHEKGKDYHQSIHYLKDHGPGPSAVPISVMQRKFVPWVPRSSLS